MVNQVARRTWFALALKLTICGLLGSDEIALAKTRWARGAHRILDERENMLLMSSSDSQDHQFAACAGQLSLLLAREHRWKLVPHPAKPVPDSFSGTSDCRYVMSYKYLRPNLARPPNLRRLASPDSGQVPILASPPASGTNPSTPPHSINSSKPSHHSQPEYDRTPPQLLCLARSSIQAELSRTSYIRPANFHRPIAAAPISQPFLRPTPTCKSRPHEGALVFSAQDHLVPSRHHGPSRIRG